MATAFLDVERAGWGEVTTLPIVGLLATAFLDVDKAGLGGATSLFITGLAATFPKIGEGGVCRVSSIGLWATMSLKIGEEGSCGTTSLRANKGGLSEATSLVTTEAGDEGGTVIF